MNEWEKPSTKFGKVNFSSFFYVFFFFSFLSIWFDWSTMDSDDTSFIQEYTTRLKRNDEISH